MTLAPFGNRRLTPFSLLPNKVINTCIQNKCACKLCMLVHKIGKKITKMFLFEDYQLVFLKKGLLLLQKDCYVFISIYKKYSHSTNDKI